MNRNGRILIVDDEPSAIQVMRKTLTGMADLLYATSGVDALAIVEKEAIDLVLLDANMPGMDGFTTCEMLHRHHAHIPVVFVTADSDFAREIRALEAGALDFISKPINPPVVRARVSMHLRLKAQSDLLRSLNNLDPLTGIANRRALEEALDDEWRRAARRGHPISLLMIDVDHFKPYNDHYGHRQGDECLKQVAGAIDGAVNRAGDLVARYGGEEFCALLAGGASQEAAAVGEKIRLAVAELRLPHTTSGTAPYVTLSIGAATADARMPSRSGGDEAASGAEAAGGDPARALLERADRALYAAKHGGRNRVRVDAGESDACPGLAALAQS